MQGSYQNQLFFSMYILKKQKFTNLQYNAFEIYNHHLHDNSVHQKI